MSDEKDTSSQLEDAVGTELLNIIKNGSTEVTKEGEVVKVSAPASYFAAAVAYLKHRPPKGQPTIGSPKGALKEYLEGLPFGAKPTSEEHKH
jgi:hypothetical protein